MVNGFLIGEFDMLKNYSMETAKYYENLERCRSYFNAANFKYAKFDDLVNRSIEIIYSGYYSLSDLYMVFVSVVDNCLPKKKQLTMTVMFKRVRRDMALKQLRRLRILNRGEK